MTILVPVTGRPIEPARRDHLEILSAEKITVQAVEYQDICEGNQIERQYCQIEDDDNRQEAERSRDLDPKRHGKRRRQTRIVACLDRFDHAVDHQRKNGCGDPGKQNERKDDGRKPTENLEGELEPRDLAQRRLRDDEAQPQPQDGEDQDGADQTAYERALKRRIPELREGLGERGEHLVRVCPRIEKIDGYGK